ncbi:Serine threonine- kinase KIN4 [Lecanosticta acicola]|uniref:Serine threonine- kinase KIN4 n=1 Tax=Lecanosticta acicola TaxID=111012 RepID=A0AAI9E9N7_9PEZI|nr:Serine threonine- kinase KIN4 [Lecanosticta acicola]
MATTSTSMPPASLPIRTSSQPHTPSHSATAAAYDTRGYTSRSSRSQGQAGYGSESDNERQRSQRSPREQTSSSRSERHRTAPSQSRSATAVGQPPMGTDLPRENSAIINRIVVDEPEADLAREKARMAEATPNAGPSDVIAMASGEAADVPPVARSRHEHLKHQAGSRRESKFGDYILGNTIGSGEFGKVKMGWKKDSPVQVAVKLIRKDMVGNTNRQAKIEREIDILKNLRHPNIVRLHEFVETERYMGIILEYASGGELFDYILTHRYLKDPAARRLFAQLISGVGYLHANGIVHRDLKLENLLLDRNKHIIITDFGFANTFDSNDELPDSIVARIMDKDYVKREGLDKLRPRKDGKSGGWRRGDLMQTSCGSPCYAAPELVVHDGLYTGRLVDVWSCGVILYAMLAGYLPFDDDPANPDGDNINLLYKYICSTPLTFPEFVSPHARDLLRRILVPEPRHRADLFEVARHSWLSEYSHVVGFIGSRVTSDRDMSQTAVQNEEDSQLGRSASVREPSTRSPVAEVPSKATTFIPRHGPCASVGGDEASDFRKQQQQRDAKRRTVQIEYPYDAQPAAAAARNANVSTQAKPVPASSGSSSGKTRASPQAQGPVEVSTKKDEASMAPPSWGAGQRPMSESTTPADRAPSRPNTSGTLIGGTSRLPSRGNSYSQPAAAQPTNTTAQGSFSQPKSNSGYIIAGSMSGEQGGVDSSGRPVSEQNRTGGQYAGAPQQPYQQGRTSASGHRRSSTLGSLADKVLNKSGSRRSSQQENASSASEKRDRRYPPVSMKNTMPQTPQDESGPRPSSDSRRPSFGFSRKASKERDSSVQGRRASGRRFSWLPGSLSMASFTGKKDQGYESGDDGYRPPPKSQQSQQSRMSRPPSKGMAFGRGTSDAPSEETTNSTIPLHDDEEREMAREQRRQQSRYDKSLPPSPGAEQSYGTQRAGQPQYPTSSPVQRKPLRDDGYGSGTLGQQDQQEPVERFYTPNQESAMRGSSSQSRTGQYGLSGQGEWEQFEPSQRQQGLRPQQRRLGYDNHGHGGSSNAAKRVMNYFRSKRGKDLEA